MAALTNKNGTSQVDELTYTDAVSNKTFSAGAGNDVITITGGTNNTYNLDAGYNTIYVKKGTGTIINAGSGKDTITVYNGTVKAVNGGALAASFKITNGTVDSVKLGKGGDKVVIGGGTVNNLSLGDGYNYVYVNSGTVGTITGGNTNDTLTVSAGAVDKIVGTNTRQKLTVKAAGKVTEASLGGGSDVISLENDAEVETLRVDSGDNYIYLYDNAQVTDTIYGGTGKDCLRIAAGKINNIVGGSGTQRLTLDGGTVGSIDTGAGDDLISVTKANVDSISLNSGSNQVYVYGGSVGTITTGTGSDKIKITGGTVNKIVGNTGAAAVIVEKTAVVEDISLGAGDDVLKVVAVNNITANLGAGMDNVDVSGGTGHEIYTDENNVDDYADIVVISGSTNNSHFFTLGGKDTVTVKGSAADNLSILTGGAADTITVEGGNKIKVYGDTGADEITVLGGTNLTVMGDEDNDRIIVLDTNNRITDSTFHLGSGDDYISLKNTTGCKINASSGHNTVYLLGDSSAKDNYIIAGGNGSDIDVSGCSNTLIESFGSQKSNITIRSYLEDNSQTACNMNLSNGINVVQILRPLKDSTINTGSEYDIFYLNYSPTAYTPLASFSLSNVTINAGAGNNVLKANNLYGGSFNFGDGDNTVDLNGCNNAVLSFGKGINDITLNKCYDLTVAGSVSSPTVLSTKSEIITATDSSWLKLKTGDGDDYIYLKDSDHTGNSYNLVDAGQGDDHIIKYYGDKNYIYGLEGADTITVYSGYQVNVSGSYKNIRSDYDKISGGAGNDDIRVNYSDKVYICGGSGDDKLVLSESKTFCIKGGLGNDTITLHNAEKGIVYGGAGNDEFILSKAELKMQNGVITPQALVSYNPSYVTLVGGAGDDKYNYWVGGNVYIDNKTGHTSSDKDTICIGVTNSSGGITGDLWNDFTTKYNVYYFQDSDSVIIKNQADSTTLCISGFSLLDSISIYCGTSKSSSEWLSWAQGTVKTTNNGTTFYQDMNKRGINLDSFLSGFVTSESSLNFDTSDSTLAVFKAYDSDLKISGNF